MGLTALPSLITPELMVIFLVRGDDIFEAEHLPSYARTYILPRQMVRVLHFLQPSSPHDKFAAFKFFYLMTCC